MPPVIKVEDQSILVATTEYPYAKWKYEKFNPVQSRMMDFYETDYNGLIAARTSAGKTVAAEIFLAQEIRKRGGKGMFLAPLRALGREKYVEWSDPNYHFGDIKTSICTGDFRLTKERKSELAEANMIVMTSEMLSHLSRNKSDQNNFLLEVGTLIIDESHLLGVKNRGPHLEVGLMKFTDINPKARLVLLSATMPNVEEIADWISYALTKRDTFMLRSNYRPVPLTIHYETYDDSQKKYDRVEAEKVLKALEIVEWYKDDKFLVFAHTKRTGELMKTALKKAGIESQFHNADLEANEKAKLEDRFKTDPKLRVIIATSTLAWGLNLPARRVVILGVHRGLEEVESHDVIQMVGRSGRLGIDLMGDAYVLVPESREQEFRTKLSKPKRIESQLLTKQGERYSSLAFHLVSEIHHGDIQTTEDVHDWYKRSLAHFQNKSLEETVIEQTLESLRKCGAIFQEVDKWKTRPIGKVSSMFYFSPFDASDLYFNFQKLFNANKDHDDYHIAVSLGNIDSQKMGIVSRIEKDEMSLFQTKLRSSMPGLFLNDAACKASYCYYNMLNGTISQACAGIQRNMQADFSRISQVLQALDSFAGNWERKDWFKSLESRITNGVPAHLINLCRLPNIGRVRATKLYDAGIKTVEDLVKSDADLKSLLNLKQEALNEVLKNAKSIDLGDSII